MQKRYARSRRPKGLAQTRYGTRLQMELQLLSIRSSFARDVSQTAFAGRPFIEGGQKKNVSHGLGWLAGLDLPRECVCVGCGVEKKNDSLFLPMSLPTTTTKRRARPGHLCPGAGLGFVCFGTSEFMSIENLKTYDPFAEADEDTGETKQTQNYIHIRIQQRNGRKTLTTVQGLPKKFDQKKILKVIKKKFACNGTIVNDSEMGEVIQLQGDQRKDVQEFLIDKKEGLELDAKTIKVHGF
ncbi:hypothetical protein NM208_g16210 [Fusarium decemcellulare]|uniref:Uncharacterized protein n=1 Tax=Fusarium decemcellulare TaxID=57161 RepID=A0ACC1RC45_9HYPO|nr:hypothetical protein NM208_g16210 [Fusarium decemcellulare]